MNALKKTWIECQIDRLDSDEQTNKSRTVPCLNARASTGNQRRFVAEILIPGMFVYLPFIIHAAMIIIICSK